MSLGSGAYLHGEISRHMHLMPRHRQRIISREQITHSPDLAFVVIEVVHTQMFGSVLVQSSSIWGTLLQLLSLLAGVYDCVGFHAFTLQLNIAAIRFDCSRLHSPNWLAMLTCFCKEVYL